MAEIIGKRSAHPPVSAELKQCRVREWQQRIELTVRTRGKRSRTLASQRPGASPLSLAVRYSKYALSSFDMKA